MIKHAQEEAIIAHIKEDVNFLSYPNWIISSKKKPFNSLLKTAKAHMR